MIRGCGHEFLEMPKEPDMNKQENMTLLVCVYLILLGWAYFRNELWSLGI